MPFEWLAKIESLTPKNLTIREQARLVENPLDLRWRAIAPRVPADSIKIADLTTVDFRPVGGRREWNAQGREIVEKLGPIREFEMVPINPTHHIDERRLQQLRERGQGMQSLVDAGIIHDVDTWPGFLADAVDRQIERDFFDAWATNTITVYDPKTEKTVSVSMGIDSARYQTESPIWNSTPNDANAGYARMLYRLGEAQRLMGSVGAVRLRRASWATVVATAPNGPNGLRPTVANVADRLSEEGFGQIAVIIDERTYDEYLDGGSTVTQKPYIPAEKVLFQPASGVVGRTHFAPVTRAYDFLSAAEIRQGVAQDVTVFLSEKNDGKTLLIEAQANALSINDPSATYVVDAGA